MARCRWARGLEERMAGQFEEVADLRNHLQLVTADGPQAPQSVCFKRLPAELPQGAAPAEGRLEDAPGSSSIGTFVQLDARMKRIP